MMIRTIPTLLVACLLAGSFLGPAHAATIAYDGFHTDATAPTYTSGAALTGGSPQAKNSNTVGFTANPAWEGSNGHTRTESAGGLSHSLITSTQPGRVKQLHMNGQRATKRNADSIPSSSLYTLSLLFRQNFNTATTGDYEMAGFTPNNTGNDNSGNDGALGLSLGYYNDDLALFAGGSTAADRYTILGGFQHQTTYLLVAEMTANAGGNEFIRAFYAADGAAALTAAPFNSNNGGLGLSLETWSAPSDLIELEIYERHTGQTNQDIFSWDEVRLTDEPVPASATYLRPAISVDFNRGQGETNGGVDMIASEPAGLEPRQNWNQARITTQPLTSVIAHDGNVVSGVQIAWNTGGSGATNNGNGGGATPNERMMHDYVAHNPAGTDLEVTVTGLPADYTSAGFDLILYQDSLSSQNGQHTFDLDYGNNGSVDDTLILAGTGGANYADTGDPATDFANYHVRFTVPSGVSDFKVTASGTVQMELNAMQIVSNIPEPSSFALAAVGLLGMLGWGRSKRE